jgi:hypothetical protein
MGPRKARPDDRLRAVSNHGKGAGSILHHDQCQGLWVPAFAGTTIKSEQFATILFLQMSGACALLDALTRHIGLLDRSA